LKYNIRVKSSRLTGFSKLLTVAKRIFGPVFELEFIDQTSNLRKPDLRLKKPPHKRFKYLQLKNI